MKSKTLINYANNGKTSAENERFTYSFSWYLDALRISEYLNWNSNHGLGQWIDKYK